MITFGRLPILNFFSFANWMRRLSSSGQPALTKTDKDFFQIRALATAIIFS